MGIKFRCPNGHKLNVKSFLAGKRGICPHCGVSVQIPGDAEQGVEAELAGGVAVATAAIGAIGSQTATLADTVTLPNTIAPMGAATVGVNPMPISVATVAPMPSPGPVSAPAPTPAPIAVAASPVMPQVPIGAPVSAPIVAAAAPVVPAVAAPLAPSPYAVVPAAPIDPITEAPNAVWYVRPPSGGQFGPARGDIMRKWLGEGRVSSDSLVWRDGWADWKSAAAVFPSLGGSPVPAPGAPLLSAAAPAALPSKNAAARSIRAKKRGNSFAIGMVIGLGLLAVLLLVVFIAVLSGALGGS
jgi:hypothetical protein